MEPDGSRGWTVLVTRLRRPRLQLALLGGLLGAVVLAILITDVATGGDTESPPALGAAIDVTPGARTVVVPTLAPIDTPTTAAVVTATPSSAADALARDAQRLEDLDRLRSALEEYRDRFDSYPNTDGNVQTMCAYEDLDKGCDLKDVLDDGAEDVLSDPLGESIVNGYWYASDGDSYTIWMLREGPGNPGEPVCPESNPHLTEKGPLFCVTVGAESP